MKPAAIKNQGGLASLPTVLAITMLIVALGALVTALATAESEASEGMAAAARARQHAETGVRDALERVARNRHYLCQGPTASCPAGSYDLELVPGGCASQAGCVTVTVGGTDTAKAVKAVGVSGKSVRTINAALTLDQNGVISEVVWSE